MMKEDIEKNEEKSKFDKVKSFLSDHSLTLGIAVVATLAYFFPQPGSHKVSNILMKVGIGIVFFIDGIKMKTKELKEGLLFWKMHILTQVFIFVIFPALIFGFVSLGKVVIPNSDNHKAILIGLLILGCCPCTSTSSAMFAKMAGGNFIVASFNSIVSNLVGVFLTPAILYLLLPESPTTPVYNVLRDLSYMIIIPLIAGKIMEVLILHKIMNKVNIPFGLITKFLLLFIIWTIISDTFASKVHESLSALTILFLFLFLIFVYYLMIFVGMLLSLIPGIVRDRGDTVVLITVCTSKSLGNAIPMIAIMFAGSPDVGLYQIPLLIFGPLQITLSGIMNGFIKKWRYKDPKLQQDILFEEGINDEEQNLI
eukprot:TRINITY_DN833_c1_g1_i1.p1 TRINITY_DN833_c1_g1~~TRINITY_DN833_c1_g1_i1.p1  ORF type:complete len:368 (+),score=74.41 TRINITY_DN833_c1_g1_i1:137-1240(+)